MNLKNKKIIITGATGGIGNSLVKKFTDNGSIVLATGTKEEKLNNLKNKFSNIYIEKFNLAEHKNIESFIEDASNKLGGIDVLVNNAGVKQLTLVGEEYSVAEVPLELWAEVINTNLRGCFLCTRAVLPGMLNRKSGRVIHVTSGHGKKGRVKRSPYVSSKFGAEGFHWTLSLELKNTPVDSLVFTPPPGGVRTNEAAYVEDPLKNMNHDPDVIIKPMVKLASGEGRNGGRYRGKGDGEGYEETDYIFEN